MAHRCINLDSRLVAKIDEHLDDKKHNGLPRWRSRAGFVQEAVELYLMMIEGEKQYEVPA